MGSRRRGRPIKIWNDVVKNDILDWGKAYNRVLNSK